MHLHLSHSLPHTGPHTHTKGNEAVWVMLVVASHPPAAARHLCTEPPLRDEVLCVYKLRLIMTDCIMTQMELSLKRENNLMSEGALCITSSAAPGSAFLPSLGTSSYPQPPRSLK